MGTRTGPSRQPTIGSTKGVLSSNSPAPGQTFGAAAPSSVSTALVNPAQRFRKLIWDSTIPIAVSVEIASDTSTAPGMTDRSIETYYVRAPRISYLALVLQEVRSNLLSIMLDEESLSATREEDYWFTHDGTPLRWHWPIGLLYDYHAVNMAPTTYMRSGPDSRASGSLTGLSGAMRRLSMAPENGGAPMTGESYFSSFQPPQHQTTDNGAAAGAAAQAESVPYFAPRAPLPWRITLHIGHAPLDKLHSAPGLDNCRASFMSMVKEADFVRHGSTKRVVNLRRTEQDALWDGVLQHDFDVYWSVASKLIPSAQSNSVGPAPPTSSNLSPSRAPSIASMGGGEGGTSFDRIGMTTSQLTARPGLMQQYNESQASLQSAAPSESNISEAESAATTARSGMATYGIGPPAQATGSAAAMPGGGTAGGHGYRSLPMRFHLVGGAPVVQEPVAPYTEDGRPITLHTVLSALFPLLFPPTPTFAPSSAMLLLPPPPLAYAVVQGVRLPMDAEINWVGSVLPSADGWVTVCIHLLADGEKA